MKCIKGFDISMVPAWKILFVATTEPDYEMDRTILVENYPNFGDYTLIEGGHCSCYDFDDTKWGATVYGLGEMLKVVRGWLEHSYGSERIIAPLILSHFRLERTGRDGDLQNRVQLPTLRETD